MLDGQKTDYNDLLKCGRMEQIQADIEGVIGQKEVTNKGDDKAVTTKIEPHRHEKIVGSPSTEREIVG